MLKTEAKSLNYMSFSQSQLFLEISDYNEVIRNLLKFNNLVK
jgi:hypothetical protein